MNFIRDNQNFLFELYNVLNKTRFKNYIFFSILYAAVFRKTEHYQQHYMQRERENPLRTWLLKTVPENLKEF